MTDKGAVVKIIGQHVKDYNDLDIAYKRLGVKHLTLLEVHKKTVEEASKRESIHHEFEIEHAELVSRAVDLKTANKKLRVLLKAAKAEIEKVRKDIVEDLYKIKVAIECKHGWNSVIYHIRKWEAKKQ